VHKITWVGGRRMLWVLTGCGLLIAVARNLNVGVGGGWEAQSPRAYANDCAERAHALADQEGELVG
jgi:hypothetical protein